MPMTIRLVLSIATSLGWDIQQLDVQNAFLHGKLEETVYMSQPPGFVDPLYPTHVCKLDKALYGLKQSSRAWFHTLRDALLSYGFQASSYDPSLFTFHQHSCTIALLVYVDDIIIAGNSPTAINSIIQTLQQHFAIKTLGPISFFLGIQVSPTKTGLHLSQTKYLQNLLLKANMHTSKPCSTPMVPNSPLSKFDGQVLDNPSFYRAIIGALQYATITRPGITFAVNKVSQFMHNPTFTHWAAVKRILRYLNGTPDLGLHIQQSSSLQLHAYSDADWAGCPDDRRSTSDFCIFLSANLISWSSKK